MKKIATIFLAAILIFNLCGYLLLVDFLKYREQFNVQQIIENKNYLTTELMELSTTVDLPYLSDWQGWEQLEGIVVINKVPYQFVERKLQGGRMYYRCLPNNGLHRVLSARDNFLKLSYDITHLPTKESPFTSKVQVKPPIVDMICLDNLFRYKFMGSHFLKPFCPMEVNNLSPVVIPIPSPPPDFS